MEAHAAVPYLREALLFLVAAGLAVPLLSRVKVNPVLGYLLIGSIVGPYGLGLLVDEFPAVAPFVIADIAGVRSIAEIGVVFLMFMIGLELSLNRVWSYRQLVFGLGGLQILITGAVVFWIARMLGVDVPAAIVIGAALSLSSTAIGMQLLIQERRLATPVGRTGFSILLMQDLAVVPILFMVGVLALPDGGDLAGGLGAALGKAALAIVGIYAMARLLVRPLLRQVAQAHSTEMFTAAILLVVIGVSALTAAFDLSMALGALLAGLLLAETEYKHQIEVDIEPFKGLLLGLFFMSVGMGIDWRYVLSETATILTVVALLWLIKALIIAVLARLFRRSTAVAVETGLLLGQSGEFAFVIIGAAAISGIVGGALEQQILIIAGLSMFLTPVVARLAQAAGRRLERDGSIDAASNVSGIPHDIEGHVIIVGFGRVGQTVARVFDAEAIAYIALDTDAALVGDLRSRGLPVFYGDAARVEIVSKVGIDRATCIVVTMNDARKAEQVVREIRRRWPLVPIHARARDPEHARNLKALGASDSIPETVEASLQLASNVLVEFGVEGGAVQRRVMEQRVIESG